MVIHVDKSDEAMQSAIQQYTDAVNAITTDAATSQGLTVTATTPALDVPISPTDIEQLRATEEHHRQMAAEVAAMQEQLRGLLSRHPELAATTNKDVLAANPATMNPSQLLTLKGKVQGAMREAEAKEVQEEAGLAETLWDALKKAHKPKEPLKGLKHAAHKLEHTLEKVVANAAHGHDSHHDKPDPHHHPKQVAHHKKTTGKHMVVAHHDEHDAHEEALGDLHPTPLQVAAAKQKAHGHGQGGGHG